MRLIWALFFVVMAIWLVGVIAFGNVLGWFVWVMLGIAITNLLLALFTGRDPIS